MLDVFHICSVLFLSAFFIPIIDKLCEALISASEQEQYWSLPDTPTTTTHPNFT